MIKVADTSLVDLGFDVIKKSLINQSNSARNKEYFHKLKPNFKINELLIEYKYTNELLISLNKKNFIPNSSIPNSSNWLARLKISGSKLNNEDFKSIYTFMNIFIELKNAFKCNHFNLWKSDLIEIPTLDNEKKAIEKVFDDQFNVKKDATVELKNINKDIENLNNNLKKNLNAILKKYNKKQWLQENKFFWQNGRTVLPLISKYKNKVKGVIHGESSTHQTSFFEPLEIINVNNEIYNFELKKIKEENKILEHLTALFYEKLTTIESMTSLIYKYDKHNSIAKIAFKSDSIEPNIDSNKSMLIENGINPIINITKKVVPLNLSLEDNRGIIITGPNAGGKTVVLKTIGLFYVMAYSGLFIPAKKILLPKINAILTDIGDGQSIENDLSTFSAHIKNLSYMIKKSTKNTLILIDEIGTGTDPISGSAISISILEEILSSGALMVGSTHLGQIKNWAHNKDKVQNARMVFDLKNLKPTFELELGLPGSSYCFEIAKRMGINQTIIDKSKTLVDSENLNIESLIEDLEQERNEVFKKDVKLKNELHQANLRKIELKEEILKIEQHDIKNKKIINKEIQKIIKETRDEINYMMKDFHASKGDTKTTNKIKENLKSIQKKYKFREKKNYKLLNIKEIIIGQQLYIPYLKMNGIVESVNQSKKTVKINCVGKKIHIDICNITLPSKKNVIKDEIISTTNSISFAKSNKIDLRGMSKIDAIDALGKFIDQAILSNLNQLHIIHGIGNGVLKNAVHSYLSEIDYIEFDSAHQNNGGYGATDLQLKNS